jgi:membrane associated rhomboid family serine protease
VTPLEPSDEPPKSDIGTDQVPAARLMRRPPPFESAFRFPVTAATALGAIVASVFWWKKSDMSLLMCDFEVSQGEVWRLVTSTLLHVNLVHLAFNLYWLWLFGSIVEGALGHLWTAAVFVLFALASSAAEYAVAMGGVGLSGVVYGLFGLLWVLSRRDGRFADAIDKNTIGLFIIWFFICIAATIGQIMNVGNVAHSAGLVAGLILGGMMTWNRMGERLAIWLMAGLVLVFVVGALAARPWINFTANLGDELADFGYRDLEQNRYERAVTFYTRALERNRRQAGWWYNLGIAYARLGRHQKALEAYEHAVELKPDLEEFKKTRDDMKAYLERTGKLKGGQ